MTSTTTTILNCRICKTPIHTDIIALGEQYITSRFPAYNDWTTPKTNITICLCNHCGLVQLKETTNCEELYEYEYGYRSGISNTMRTHLKSYQEEIISKVVELAPGDAVLDIGSNDATMLHNYSKNLVRIGMDPTGNQFQDFYDNDMYLVPTYFTLENFRRVFPTQKCKIVSSISMFYDLPDPVQFAKDIYDILDDDGIWTCEQSYLLTMLRKNSIDTICHEHLEYYALHQIVWIARESNFKIIDVKFNDCNGGSFRVYFAKQHSTKYREATELIHQILMEEVEYGIQHPETYKQFMVRCNTEIDKLKYFIETVNANEEQMYVYGASTKGNCLLQYGNITQNDIRYAVERNPSKIGKMASTGIEIIGEETMRETPPRYLLVLPYHFKNEIIEREEVFLRNGGKLVFPLPVFEIYGTMPGTTTPATKVLITGCDGTIAHYVKAEMPEYELYGISRNPIPTPDPATCSPSVLKFSFDLRNIELLEKTILTVRPDIIIHLASISSSLKALDNPVETMETNGMVAVNLCDIIHSNKLNTRMFHASSSDIYKGHIQYCVREDDTHKHHLHPYSIAKIMAHDTVSFYRETFGCRFSNGVLFTTESPRKGPQFLLNKVSAHIQQWKTTGTNTGTKETKENKTPLVVGNLDSYRSIIHAEDVARAIHIIVSQETGDDYIICTNQTHKMFDLVMKLFEEEGIELVPGSPPPKAGTRVFYEKNTENIIMIIEDDDRKCDTVAPTNISGNATKLRKLGWVPFWFDTIMD